MKKYNKVLAIAVIIINALFVINANAASVAINKIGDQGVPTASGGSYKMNIYRGTINGVPYMTYCVDAGRPYGGNGVYNVWRRIDPSTSKGNLFKFDVAATIAYQFMQENGYAETTMENNVIGELVFRWITEVYISAGNPGTPQLSYASGLFRKLTSGFSQNDPRVVIASNIFTYAQNVANQVNSYEELLQREEYKAEKWEVTNQSIQNTIDDVTYEMKVSLKPTGPMYNLTTGGAIATSTNPNIIIFNEYTKIAPTSDGGIEVTIVFNGHAWDKQSPLGLSVKFDHCDPSSAASQLYLVQKNGTNQRMLVVLPGTEVTCGKNYPHSTYDGSGIRIPDDPNIPGDYGSKKCSCDKRDGTYTYIREKNGIEVERYTWKSGEEPPAGLDVSTCPPTSECENPNIPKDIEDESCICQDPVTGLYLYKKYKNNELVDTRSWLATDPGSKVWEQQYNCPPCGDTTENKCKKSDNSSTGYFCSDGKECNEETFMKDPREDPRGCGDIICTKSAASSTGYFCRDGSECSEEIFKKHPNDNPIGCGDKYPSRTCEKPSEENGNKWYCKDGNECDEQGYYKDCECDSLPPESEEYKKYCLNCNPTITVPKGCKNLSDNDPSKGTLGDINTVQTECNQDVDQIKYCVLGKEDLLGNTFEATEELKDNPYCKVWCKEDYDFKLPTAKLTQSGGYFTLATTLTGTRSCYVSSADEPTKGIDEDKFNKDLEAAQHAVIDAYNEYNYYKEAAEAEVSKNTVSDTGQCEYSCTDSEGNSKTCYRDGASGSVTEISLSWSAKQYNYDGSLKANRTGSFSDGDINCSCDSCDKHEGHDRRTDEGWHGGANGNEHREDNSAKYNTDSSKYGTLRDDRFPTLELFDPRNPNKPTTPSNRDDSDESKSYTKLMEEKKAILVEKINALNNIISQYNSCSGIVVNSKTSDIATNDPSSTSSTSWENKMLWDGSDEQNSPIVDFVYNEDYLKNMNGQFKEVSGSNKSKNEFCSGEINDHYECIGDSTNDIVTKDKNYIICDENGCYKTSSNVSTAKWVTKTKERTATYQIDESFSTSTPYGVVKFQSEACSGNDCLWSRLPEGSLPVQLNRNTGLFPFKFTFRNVGQFNNVSTTGRIIGKNTSDSSVLTEYNKLSDSEKCTKENVSPTTDGSYVCYYLNNCDDCVFECDPDDPNHCEFGCNGDNCDMVCDNCIFDGGQAVYSYRTVSLNSLFPNERKVGSNWNVENQKAQITQNAIDDLGETIYETPQYSFELTPENLKNIRKYNDEAGSYINSTVPFVENGEGGKDALYCETKVYNGIEYKINCKSRFLDMVENTRGYATVNKRITSSNANVGGLSERAFELYTDYVEDCEEGECITTGIGPSWRIRSGN